MGFGTSPVINAYIKIITTGMPMIPKNAYALICSNDEEKNEIIYPTKNQTGLPYQEQYLTDYKEVEEYISTRIVGKFNIIGIVKMIDILEVKIQSKFKVA